MPAFAPGVNFTHAKPLLLDFALQGGGSHGAFTWGVLDRLLEESPGCRLTGFLAHLPVP